MSVGIGVITCGVRPLHDLLVPEGAVTLVHHDIDRRGVSYSRNEVLHGLYRAGCEYIFLFDDDCYPVMPGWAEYFIAQHHASGLPFLGLPEIFSSQLIASECEINYWNSVVGCFSFRTRALLDRVGYYSEAYTRYGYEDVAYHDRVRRELGLCGMPSPIRATGYVHSQDVFGEHPTPNMTVEEKTAGIEAMRPIWLAEMASPKIFYPHPREAA